MDRPRKEQVAMVQMLWAFLIAAGGNLRGLFAEDEGEGIWDPNGKPRPTSDGGGIWDPDGKP